MIPIPKFVVPAGVGSCGACKEKAPLVRNPRGGTPRCTACLEKEDLERTHILKCRMPYFEEVASGRKKFEARKNDRGFQVGDVLHLREVTIQSDAIGYVETGRSKHVRVTYILSGLDTKAYGVSDEFVVMSIEDVFMEQRSGLDGMDGDRFGSEVFASLARNGIPREMWLSMTAGLPIGYLIGSGMSDEEVRQHAKSWTASAITGARQKLEGFSS